MSNCLVTILLVTPCSSTYSAIPSIFSLPPSILPSFIPDYFPFLIPSFSILYFHLISVLNYSFLILPYVPSVFLHSFIYSFLLSFLLSIFLSFLLSIRNPFFLNFSPFPSLNLFLLSFLLSSCFLIFPSSFPSFAMQTPMTHSQPRMRKRIDRKNDHAAPYNV